MAYITLTNKRNLELLSIIPWIFGLIPTFELLREKECNIKNILINFNKHT